MWLAAMAVALVGITVIACPSSVGAQQLNRPPNAVTLFAARLTGNEWEDLTTLTNIRFRDTYLAGAGFSRRLTTFFDALDIEVLGQTALHFGHAHQWEFDGALAARWTYFPWNNVLATSVAFGLGPSYETQTPPEEQVLNGQSKQWLAFWVFELEAGPPESVWSGVVRIHHRSTAFGLFGKAGGSNWLELGIRRHF